MPILSNARHERFAQALAEGQSASAAYQAAGYKRNDGNASTLKADQRISKRVSELLQERADIHGQVTAAAIASVALTKQWVIEGLIKNAQCDERAASNRAYELLGKELGMFVERQIQDQNVRILSDKPIDDEEWERQYAPGVGAANGATESAH